MERVLKGARVDHATLGARATTRHQTRCIRASVTRSGRQARIAWAGAKERGAIQASRGKLAAEVKATQAEEAK